MKRKMNVNFWFIFTWKKKIKINNIENVNDDDLIQSYLITIDKKNNKKEIKIIYKINIINNIKKKDILYEIYNKNELNSERLLFIIEHCTAYLNISSFFFF